MFPPKFTKSNGPDGSLFVYKYRAWVMPLVLAVMGAYLLLALYLPRLRSRSGLSTAGGAAVSMLFATLRYENNLVVLDEKNRCMSWKIFHPWRLKSSGDIPFGNITNIFLDALKTANGGPATYRIVLDCGDFVLPLSNCYLPDKDALEKIRTEMKEIIQPVTSGETV